MTGRLRWDGGGHAAPGTTIVAPGGKILVTGLRGHACGSPSLEAGRRLVNQGLLRVEAGDLFTDGTPRPTIENAARIELAAAACRPPRFRPLGGRRARRDRPRPVAGRRDLLELWLGAGLMGRDGAHGVAAVARAGAAHDRSGPRRT